MHLLYVSTVASINLYRHKSGHTRKKSVNIVYFKILGSMQLLNYDVLNSVMHLIFCESIAKCELSM